MTTTTTADAGPIDVPLAGVDKALSRLLKQAHGHSESPVHRARMSNLIVYCRGRERAEYVDSLIPAIVAVHPARVLLLVEDEAAAAGEVSASALVRKAGARAQLSSEQVTLRCRPEDAEDLPFAVRGLLVGDLPTNLWWADSTPPALAGPFLDELAETAQQVIYDSLGWPDPHRGIAATAPWLARFERDNADRRWRVASDLNWRRLKTWRRLIAQTFAPAGAPGALDSVSELLIEHGPHAVTQAWQLIGWFASRIGWTIHGSDLRSGTEIALDVQSPRYRFRVRIDRLPDGPSALRRLRVTCALDGKAGALDMVDEGGVRLCVRPEGIDASPRTLGMPPADDAATVGRQLSDREPDPVFREAMDSAHLIAEALLR